MNSSASNKKKSTTTPNRAQSQQQKQPELVFVVLLCRLRENSILTVTYQLRSDCEFFVASAYSWHWIFQLWTS
jgi:hypothetical protein